MKGRQFAAGFSGDAVVALAGTRMAIDPARPVVEAGAPVTVQIERLFLGENEDGGLKGSSEIVLIAEHWFQSEPVVQTVHLAESGVRPPIHFAGLPGSVVYATEDFDGRSRLTLRFAVVEIDALSDDTVEGMKSAIQGGGALFPALAPFLGLAAGVAASVIRVADAWDSNDVVLESSLALMPVDGYSQSLLQFGRFVLFRAEVESDHLALAPDGSIVSSGAGQHPAGTPFRGCSYLVFSILPFSMPQTPYDVTNARAAKLLSQLNDGSRADSTLRFLRETMEGFQSFRKLRRYHELRRMANPSPRQKERLEELKNDPDIAPFL